MAADFLAGRLLGSADPFTALPFLEVILDGADVELAAKARVNRGMLRRRAGDPRGAELDFLEVARGTSDSRDQAALALGSLLAGCGRLGEARSWLATASTSTDARLADLSRRGLAQVESALAEDVPTDDEGP